MKQELWRKEIPNFITHIEISKKRRVKYDKDGNVANKRTVGTPRLKKINGQSLWVTMDHHLRSKMARELKKYMYEQIREFPEIEEFPISVDLEFHMPTGDFDIDNLSMWYRKCLFDAMAGNVDYRTFNVNGKDVHLPNHEEYPPKIPDDSVEYISENNTKFIPVQSEEDRKLVLIITKL